MTGPRRRNVLWIVVGVAALLVIGAAGTGAACKLALNCGLTGATAVEDVARPTGEPTVYANGLREDVVVGELTYPTSFDLLPDGRLLVGERDGAIWVVDDGAKAAEPALDLRGSVSTALFRGVVDVAVDPDFATNRYVYVAYTPAVGGDVASDDPTTVRLSRFTLDADGRIAPTSENVLLGSVTPETGSCADVPATSDCLPSDVDHIGLDVAFARDGTLFVTTGDGGGRDTEIEPTVLSAQDVDSLSGKVLRIDRDGRGLVGNPFAGSDLGANRAKVWALGLRNPFRMGLGDGSSTPIVGDVGSRAFDELDAAAKGANLGWPCFEGTIRSSVYNQTAVCTALYAKRPLPTGPIVAFPHAGTISVTGGTFVPADAGYGAPLAGGYLFGDWAKSLVLVARIDPQTGRLTGKPVRVASAAGGPVQFRIASDGSVYYLALNDGEVRRIVPAR